MKVKKVVVRVVKAPNLWSCSVCGGEIRAGEDCGKQGKRKICRKCVQENK